MRPRYRVWDKEEKKMVYDAEATYDGYPVDYVTSFGGMLDCPDFFDVMQYIGIKDVNSNRIYEKDIVRIITTQTGETRRGEVIYYEPNACYLVETTMGDYFTFMSCDISKVEVLGNTYENKDLLN
nr:YopX family protein [uncultured Campylobacter sp.]